MEVLREAVFIISNCMHLKNMCSVPIGKYFENNAVVVFF